MLIDWFKKVFKKTGDSLVKEVNGSSFTERGFTIRPLEELKIGSLVTVELQNCVESIVVENPQAPEAELQKTTNFPPNTRIRLCPDTIYQYIICNFFFPEDKDIWIGPQIILYDVVNNRHLLFVCSFLGFYQGPTIPNKDRREIMFARMHRTIQKLEISSSSQEGQHAQ